MKPKFTLLFILLFSILKFNDLHAQDRINTSYNSVLTKLKILSIGKDSIYYRMKKSTTVSSISIKEVASVVMDGESIYFRANYKSKNDTIAINKEAQSKTPEIEKQQFDDVDHIGNAIGAVAFAQITSLLGHTLASVAIVVVAVPAVPIVIMGVTTVVVIVKTIEFVKELRKAGKDILDLKRKVK